MAVILQINKAYYPHMGGIETVVNQYVKWLGKENTVDVLCVNSKRTFKSKKEKIDSGFIYRASSFGTFLSLPISISFFFIFFRLRNKYDIIHIHEPFPLGSLLVWLLPSKSKIIITWHSDIVKQKIAKIPFVFFQKKLCKRADIILTTSENLKNSSEIISSFPTKTQIIPLSINSEEYKETNIDSLINLPSLPEKYALFFGRFSSYKGIPILLEAFDSNLLERIPLVLVGHGKLTETQKSIITSNPNIILIDRPVSEDEKKALFQNCYVYLFPSTSKNEAFGITQLEALVYGKPVINTDLPTGVPTVSIHNETGITIPIADSEALRTAIINIYSINISIYQKWSVACKKRVITYFDDRIVEDRIKAIYNILLTSA